MAATKSTRKKTTSGRRGKKGQTQAGNFQNEIILLVVLAASALMVAGNVGLGGPVGDAFSDVLFGVIGVLAYIFPVFLFLGAAFFLSNRGNHLLTKKMIAFVVLFLNLCGFIQIITEGYVSSSTLLNYYEQSAAYHTGGGIVGGALCISTVSAFGVVGAYIILALVLFVCLILITQKSFFGFMNRILDGIVNLIKGGQEEFAKGKPERDLKRELRTQQRQKAAEERRAERVRRLEEALAREEQEEQSGAAEVPAVRTRTKQEKKKRAGLFSEKSSNRKKKEQPAARTRHTANTTESEFFLDGTQLIPDGKTVSREVTFPLEPEKAESPVEFSIHRADDRAVEEPISEELEEPAFLADPMPPMAERVQEMSREELSEPETVQEEVTPVSQEEQPRTAARNPKSSPKEIESGIRNIQHEISQQDAAVKKEYHFPPLNLLKKGDGKSQGDSDEHLRKTAQKLQEILYNFGVNATVTNVSCGPTVTRYELQPEMGVKVSKIVGLADDIKLNLAAPDIRIEAPIPGKAAVGIEVPNKENSAVMLRDLLQSQEFQGATSKLAFAAGKDIAGKPVVTDIAKMPHLLIAGATGSGKSVCINTLIISILYKAKPEEVKLIMIDPKVVELSVYNGIPHLFIPVVTDPKKAAGALNWAVAEMTNRYNTFAEYGVRNLAEYNKKVENMRIPEGEVRPDKLPQIVIIVDELADLMMVAPGEVEDAICRLAQLARAAGIHLVIATQRPSVNVITGLIKANMPSRIAFSVSSGVDSRTILDMNGAEKLLGKGDMLFYPQGYQKPARLQGAFVSDEEVSAVVEYLSNKNPVTEYNTQIEQHVNTAVLPGAGASGSDDRDVYFEEAGKLIIDKDRASIGMLQRMFKIGFNRAARIMDQLSEAGVVGPEEGTKPRKILMSPDEFAAYLEEH